MLQLYRSTHYSNLVYKIAITTIFLILHLITFRVNSQFFSMDYNENMYQYRQKHTLMSPYTTEPKNPTNQFWDSIGSTSFFQDHVRLTPDLKSQQGGIWNNVRNKMRYWHVAIKFNITGNPGSNAGGDGFVFWYVKDRMIPGPVFGSKDFFSGLAIIVDTYNNHDPNNVDRSHEHPYITIMVSNGSLRYNHELDGLDHRVGGGGCSVKLRNLQHETGILIRFDEDWIRIFTNVLGKGYWEECHAVEGVRLPTGYYFGVTAATGDLSDNHDIISIQTYEIERDKGVHSRVHGSMDNIVPFAPLYKGHKVQEGWSILKVVLVLGGVLILAAFAYALVSITGTKTKKK